MQPTRPFQSGQTPTSEQFEAFSKLAQMLRGARGDQEYTPIIKTLKMIGIEPETQEIQLEVDGEVVECLIIPIKELMAKEWQHMSGRQSNLQRGEPNDK